MLFEYAVEPQAIGSSWENFRYLIEKFGFDRGRLISQFPKGWLKEVHAASTAMKDIEHKRFVEILNRSKHTKIIRCGRPYDPALGSWLKNAITQHAAARFHAIIAEKNPTHVADVIAVDEAEENHPLMVSAHTWEVERVGPALAKAMGPLLRSANTVLFIDRFFDIRDARYRETLKACLETVSAPGANGAQCEIHYCDHDSRPPAHMIEREAGRWLNGILPLDTSITLFAWKERNGGEDFHARYLLTEIGGISVDAGFSAEGAHQKVQLGLLSLDLAQKKLSTFARNSDVYDLVEPVLEIRDDGSVRRC